MNCARGSVPAARQRGSVLHVKKAVLLVEEHAFAKMEAILGMEICALLVMTAV